MFEIFFSVKDSKKVIWLLQYYFINSIIFFCEKPREGYLAVIYFNNIVVFYFCLLFCEES